MRKFSAAAVLLLSGLSCGAAQAADIVAHRAFYRLSMASASNESNMADVQGAITYEITDACDGWIVEQQYAMRFLLSNGTGFDSVDEYSAWESKDGLQFRFNVKRLTNGDETERVRGRAVLEAKGGAGMATFESPSADRIALSAGTVFPTEHMVILLDRAESGAKFDRRLVFDGSKAEPASPVTSIILGQLRADPDNIVAAPVGPDPVWPMKLAFYPAEGQGGQGEELPEFELRMDIQPNGIVTRLVLDFGDFTVNGILEKVESLPMSGC